MKAPIIQERIHRAEELAIRARLALDAWKALKLDTAIEPFPRAMREFDDFWRFAGSAFEAEFFIRIANLFTAHKRTENFFSLIADAQKSGVISNQVAKQCRDKIDKLGDLPQRVASIRNSAKAHQHRSLKQNELFGRAKLSLNLLTQYSDTALEIAAMLKEGAGDEPWIIHSDPSVTVKELLQFVETQLGLQGSRNE